MTKTQEAILALINLEGKSTCSQEEQEEVGQYIHGLVQVGVGEFNQTKETQDLPGLRESLGGLVGRAIARAAQHAPEAWARLPLRERIEALYSVLRRDFIHAYEEA
jgi:hypothetical protein